MDLLNVIAALLVITGLAGLILSVPASYQICSLPEYQHSGWYLLFVMILLFILGYIGFLWLLIGQETSSLEVVVAAVFCGGGGFVYNVTKMSRATIGQLQNTIAEKHYQARHDMLTTLPNRTYFYETLDKLMKHDQAQFSCLMLDLNDFKIINDTFGHAKGDQVLQVIAKRLIQSLPKHATAARIGGDELTVVLPNTNSQQAIEVAKQIQQLFMQDIDCNPHKLGIGVSIGIVQYPEHGEDRSSLLKHADIAMYCAKSKANHYQVYHKFL